MSRRALLKKLEHQIAKILREPIFGKPLRNVMRNYRRVHINSFVLVYEIVGQVIRLLDFDHHDRIYKKFS
ncbi:MAG: type II toxin-antitoxin system mRNA interferase toxin, RelE/StbE family [Candidatus Vogelbacteria bacterium]|nr:type II toxin-antitoxin system mRNA interferase toxin, RelE/StbE family [Candidatus Vogelbacteria bacterium]